MSKLLVVDDEERIRSMIRKYGEFEGHEIEEAVDGMDAIEKWAADEFRSTNGQLQWIIAEALKKSGRMRGMKEVNNERMKE